MELEGAEREAFSRFRCDFDPEQGSAGPVVPAWARPKDLNVPDIAFKAHLVRVTTDELEQQLWVAMTARRDAVFQVLQAIPEGWTAALLPKELGTGQAKILKLGPGEVCELAPNRRPPRVRLH